MIGPPFVWVSRDRSFADNGSVKMYMYSRAHIFFHFNRDSDTYGVRYTCCIFKHQRILTSTFNKTEIRVTGIYYLHCRLIVIMHTIWIRRITLGWLKLVTEIRPLSMAVLCVWWSEVTNWSWSAGMALVDVLGRLIGWKADSSMLVSGWLCISVYFAGRNTVATCVFSSF